MNTKISNSYIARAIPIASVSHSFETKIDPKQLIEYVGSVTYATNEKVLREIEKRLKRDPEGGIYLRVTSPGGASGTAMSFYDTVRSMLKPNLTTIGSGDVDSSGIIIFLSGKRRFVTKHTTLLLHMAGRRFDGSRRYTAADMEAMAKEDRLKDFQYASIVSANARALTPEEVLHMMEKNTILTPETLVSLGLAEAVLQ